MLKVGDHGDLMDLWEGRSERWKCCRETSLDFHIYNSNFCENDKLHKSVISEELAEICTFSCASFFVVGDLIVTWKTQTMTRFA